MYDLIIKNGMIVDGTGAPSFPADVAVKGGVIAEVQAHLDERSAKCVADAAGKYVSPGFVDIHRHADAALFRPDFGKLELAQGLTTIANGNCGHSIAPCPDERRADVASYLEPIVGDIPERVPLTSFQAYLDAVKEEGHPLSIETLIGDGMASAAVNGYENALPDKEATAKICALIDDALSRGARGVSLGLGYTPECYYPTEQLIKQLVPLKGTGLPLTTHIRGEGDSLHKALHEVITVAKTLGVPLQVSHLKCIGRRNWGWGMEEAIHIIDRARADGLTINCDFYPYRAGSTQLTILLPNRYLAHGIPALIELLKDPKVREDITAELSVPSDRFENTVELVGWDNIYMTTLTRQENKQYEGKSVAEIAELRGTDPFNCAYDMLIEEDGHIAMTDNYASEEDVRMAMEYPFSSIISDAIYPNGRKHPRVGGTFLRVLETYVREEKVLDLPTAVKKMTSMPASVLKLDDRGLIQKGKRADILIFDLEKVHARATYAEPDLPGEGIEHMYIAGKQIY